MTSPLIQALSRLAGNRQADGTSSLVSGEDRTVIIDGCHDLMIADRQARAALRTAIEHVEHMAAFIGAQKLGYSFESLGEDMPGMRATLKSSGAPGSALESGERRE